jgi:hypothetical protein
MADDESSDDENEQFYDALDEVDKNVYNIYLGMLFKSSLDKHKSMNQTTESIKKDLEEKAQK